MVGQSAPQEHVALSGSDAGVFRGCCRKEVKKRQSTGASGGKRCDKTRRTRLRSSVQQAAVSPTLLERVLCHRKENPSHQAAVWEESEIFFLPSPNASGAPDFSSILRSLR